MTNTDRTDAHLRPFTIDIPQAVVDDLFARLGRARFPRVVNEDETTGGLSLSYLRRLVDHWRDGFDWRAVETELNRDDHRMAQVNGLNLHCVLYRAEAVSGLPVVLLHGWPDSFYGYRRVAPLLARAGHDVVVPSLPGYPFSGEPVEPLTIELAAELVHELVTGMGHSRYAVHGGDWGSAIAEQLAAAHPESIVALHLADVPYHHLFAVQRDGLSEAETAFLTGADTWAEGASYYSVQSHDPTTLSYGLSDSPVGLAAWLSDKYRAWTDREPDLDDVLTQVSLYWFTNAARSSMRMYAEGLGSWDGDADADRGDADADWGQDDAAQWGDPVPTALAVFPHDIGVPPRVFAERFFDVRRYTVLPSGGHFGAIEEPAALAEDIVTFLAALKG